MLKIAITSQVAKLNKLVKYFLEMGRSGGDVSIRSTANFIVSATGMSVKRPPKSKETKVLSTKLTCLSSSKSGKVPLVKYWSGRRGDRRLHKYLDKL